jgi:hypothetical protein
MAVQPRRDIDIAHPLSRVKHDPSALDLTPRRGHLPRATLKLDTLVSAKLDHVAAGPGHDHYFRRRQPRSFT